MSNFGRINDKTSSLYYGNHQVPWKPPCVHVVDLIESQCPLLVTFENEVGGGGLLGFSFLVDMLAGNGSLLIGS